MMVYFLELRRAGGESLMVNVQHIVSLEHRDGVSVLTLVGGQVVEVSERPDNIVSKIREGAVGRQIFGG